MGFRFRKTIKLAPGLRLNLGTRGASLSAGPRGASVTFGRNGVFGNVGIPGTGISYRTRLDGNRARPRPSGGGGEDLYVPMTAKVLEDGGVLIADLDGNPMPEEMRSLAIRRNAPAIFEMLERRAEDLNAWFARMLSPHLETPHPSAFRHPFAPEPFPIPKPERPEPEEVGMVASWFGGKERAEARHREELAEFQTAIAEWRAAEANHRHAQEEARQLHERWLAGDPEAMQERFEGRLGGIDWPRETVVAFQTSGDGLWADIDLPEIEDMPAETAKALKGEMRVARVRKGETEIRRDYAAHVHSIAFRVAGEAFAAMPALSAATVSGYSQRQSRSTGQVEDEYLFSVRIGRGQWQAINFAGLASVDPVRALERFDLRRDMSKTGVFRPIEPFSD